METVLEQYLNYLDQEKVLFEYGHILYRLEDWHTCRLNLKNLINAYPTSKNSSLVWQFLINAAIKETEQALPEEKIATQNILVHTLDTYLSQSGLANAAEKQEYGFLLGQYKYQLGHYNGALKTLIALTNEFPKHARLADIHTLIGFAYYHKYHNLRLFTRHLEKAIISQPNHPDGKNLRLALFNAYTELSQKEPDKKELCLTAAAKNLYAAQAISSENIQPENIAWLADFYFEKAQKTLQQKTPVLQPQKIHLGKTVKLLALAAQKNLIDPLEKNLLLTEKELFQLAQIHRFVKNYPTENATLEKLHQLYTEYAATPWNRYEQTFMQLAKNNLYLQNKEQALVYFEKVKQLPNVSNSAKKWAELGCIRLRMQMIDPAEYTIQNMQVIEQLSILRNLIVLKNIAHEPLHLEAALDSIDYQCALEKIEDRAQKKLFFLKRFYKNFTNEADTLNKDYHTQRQKMPDQDAIYQNYMQLAKAEINLYKYLLSENQKTARALKHKKKALRLFTQLEKKDNLTEYLQKRLKQGLAVLKNEHS